MPDQNHTAAANFIRPDGRLKRVHLLGICGVGMAGLAYLLKQRGFCVSGCDSSPNQLAAWLRKRGIPVLAGHDPAHAARADWLIRSSAVPDTEPELAAARRAGKQIFRRGCVLAAISAEHESICVSGAHGKTTTTAMIAQVLKRAGLKPSYAIGGEAAALGGVAGGGTGPLAVMEADESDGTLAIYRPSILVVTNIEFDHAEHFKSMAALKKCYARAAARTRRKIVYCFDDPISRSMFRRRPNAFSFGFLPGADLRITGLKENSTGLACRFAYGGGARAQIRLPVPGRHNALNAAAVFAAGIELGLAPRIISRALAGFRPVARRFEKAVDRRDLLVISDYAHHPTEIAALIRAARTLKRKRWLAMFQPHRYSRTKALGKLFPPAFAGVDELVLCPVYEASEKMIAGGTSWDLYKKFRKHFSLRTLCARSPDQAWDYLKTAARPGDGILLIGAGSIGKIAARARKEYARARGGACSPVNKWRAGLAKLGLKKSLVKFNEPLGLKTTLRTGGAADIYIEAGDETELARILKWARRNRVPVKLLGSGSNALASDLGVRGIVLRLKGGAWVKITPGRNGLVTAGAGASLAAFVAQAAERNLAGAEFLAGIPGTIGGAARMNAGAWGKEFSGLVRWIRVMEPDGRARRLWKPALGFAYRACDGLKNRIVIEAGLALQRGDGTEIRRTTAANLERRRWMSALKSAGSFFKNPPGDYAGRLLEKAGLKGRRIGGARIAKEHANVITADKGASASDVLALAEMARGAVKIKFGVDLENEVEYLE